ncbi:MAG: hypothetical protein KatS3mg081_0554 [Gemmatimonadales bacterium]|nr:MAG: hypothetical protein KatS3mg081_0554 [Gemmatimonadales bacterium]
MRYPPDVRTRLRELWRGRPDLRGDRRALIAALPYRLQPAAERLLTRGRRAQSRPPRWLIALFDLVELE